MKRFLIKYNLEILTTIMFAFVTLSTICNWTLSVTQRILIAYVFLFTLHEWEENRYPGGFTNIMEGMIGKKFSEDAKELSHIPVMILLLLIHIIPYIFDSIIFLTLIPVFLGIFEGFVHTMGVKLSKAEKFYTPGMITAYMMLIASIFTIYYLLSNNMITGKDCILGFVGMFVSFAIMQNRVLAINGITYKDMFNIIKAKKETITK
ncbi:MAG: HXXEE domain-containing protein [Lachnospiraceae bacterium]|nr:HXXEE domain-containing protein [Lachnospiraceae bacterium]